MTYFLVWLVVAIVLCANVAFFSGKHDLADDEIKHLFLAATIWPAALATFLIVVPFYGLYILGERRARK